MSNSEQYLVDTAKSAIACWGYQLPQSRHPMMDNAINYLSYAVSKYEQTSTWQDITHAPKDGTPILAMVVIDGIIMARTAVWISTEISKYNPDGGFWTCPNLKCIIGEFTHWMPIPKL